MPYILIAGGLVLTIAGARGNQGQLFTLLKGDFTGPNSFLWWFASIVGIGAIGYIPEARKFSNMFLALVLLVLILAQSKNGNLFQNFVNAIKSGTAAAPDTITPKTVVSNDNSDGLTGLFAGGLLGSK